MPSESFTYSEMLQAAASLCRKEPAEDEPAFSFTLRGGRGVSFPPELSAVAGSPPYAKKVQRQERGQRVTAGRRRVGLTALEDEPWDELEQLHALRRRLLDHASDPRYEQILQAVEWLIDERGADPDCRQHDRPDSGARSRV